LTPTSSFTISPALRPIANISFERVANEEVAPFITTIVIAEVLHRQMLIEAVLKGLVTPAKP
jgi:hypothetical protein